MDEELESTPTRDGKTMLLRRMTYLSSATMKAAMDADWASSARLEEEWRIVDPSTQNSVSRDIYESDEDVPEVEKQESMEPQFKYELPDLEVVE